MRDENRESATEKFDSAQLTLHVFAFLELFLVKIANAGGKSRIFARTIAVRATNQSGRYGYAYGIVGRPVPTAPR
jgi:hypothetical protein